MDKGTATTSTTLTTRQAQMSTVVVRDATEARLLLQNIKPESELGRQLLNNSKQVHLLSKDVSKVTYRTSPAGLAIQRSTLTFSTHGNSHYRNRACELPIESLQTSASNKDLDASSNAETVKGATLLDSTLLHQIKFAFERHTGSKQDKAIDGTEQSFTCSAEKGGDDDDDEEDIFDDADGGYMPPAKTGSHVRESIPLKAKSESIFDGLTAPKVPHSTPATASSHSMTEKRQQVISCDVLCSSTMVPKRRPLKMGVSIASYKGGYGEEMDVDFDGRFAAEDEDSGKEGKKESFTKGATGTKLAGKAHFKLITFTWLSQIREARYCYVNGFFLGDAT
jgi:hypothetical protein